MRVWSKSNRRAGREWLLQYARDNPALTAVPGCTSMDPACRIAATGQIFKHLQRGGGQGGFELAGVSVLFDIEKFFDQLPVAQAIAYARRAALPAYLIRAAVVAYGWDRHLRSGPAIGQPVLPTAGIIAGDGTAMLIVAAYMAEGLRDLLAALGPRDTLQAYVDDLGFTVFAEKRLIADHAATLGRRILDTVHDMGLVINKTKTAVVCAHRSIALRVASRLGAARPKGMYRATYLGCDHAPLRPRKWRRTGSMLTARVRKVCARMRRFQTLRRVVGKRATGSFVRASCRRLHTVHRSAVRRQPKSSAWRTLRLPGSGPALEARRGPPNYCFTATHLLRWR